VSLYAWAVRDGDVVAPVAKTVAKTGQTLCYDVAGSVISCAGTGQDGEYQKGVPIPSPRFTDNGDGTVTDSLTGLMWAKDANESGAMNWQEALDYSNDLSLGLESCGSSYTDWRLPNIKELQSLIDYGNSSPALPSGHPFSVGIFGRWSSTTDVYDTSRAWFMHTANGYVDEAGKYGNLYVWPVRDAN
jgi:hypothetical protein